MFEMYNDEAELLSLMLNKDEFLRYITQHYKDNRCTLLEPLIWAIHFNVPKYQRLPLLENIILQSMTHIRINYSFLPEKQILGKTYKLLGIPTICGEPDKCFLNAYKQYKSYYPVRYPKVKTPPLNNVHISINRPIQGPHYRHRSNTPYQANQEVVSSTPITEKIPSLMINPLLSPINIPINDEYSILWTDSFFKRDLLNMQNITLNNNESKQILLSKTLGTPSVNNNNVSHQTLQNIDIAKMEYSNNTTNQMYFISRDPKCIQADNKRISSDEKHLSNIRNKEYLKTETKENENSITSEYFNKINKKRKSMKQNLSEKHEKNLNKRSKQLKNNMSIRNSIKSPSINIKKPNLIKSKQKTQKSYLESSENESWTRIKQAFSNHSLSDLDKTSQTPITMKSTLWGIKHCNSKVQDAIKLNYNSTQEKNIKRMDIEPQNYNRWNNSQFIENSSLEVSDIIQISDVDESNKYDVSSTSHINSLIFSEDSLSLLNFTSSSQQLDLIKQEFMKLSTDSCEENKYENYENQNEVPKLFNNIQFVETPYSILHNNIALNLSSDRDISIPTIHTVNNETKNTHQNVMKTEF